MDGWWPMHLHVGSYTVHKYTVSFLIDVTRVYKAFSVYIDAAATHTVITAKGIFLLLYISFRCCWVVSTTHPKKRERTTYIL